jgi:hypothetical protein
MSHRGVTTITSVFRISYSTVRAQELATVDKLVSS